VNVLLASFTLRYRKGAELYVRDLALELRRQGHSAAVYAPTRGVLAEELSEAGVPVVTRLRALSFRPDIIHGNFRRETLAAVLRYPDVPALSTCHSHMGWNGGGPVHPRIRRYLGMSRLCCDRLRADGAPADLIRAGFNFVDTTRFTPRSPLPDRPRRALLFSNYARPDTHLPAVTEACRLAGIQLDIVGEGVGNIVAKPETMLPRYDLVFAKAKAAMEAMAVGAAVVLCDFGGVGPMVTAADFHNLRPLNFGYEALRDPLIAESLLRQIRRYDPADAARVRDLIRRHASLEGTVRELTNLYAEVIAEYCSMPQAGGEIAPRRYRKQLWRETLLEQLMLAWIAIPTNGRDRLCRAPGVLNARARLTSLLFRPRVNG
jgi:hypothetical protein